MSIPGVSGEARLATKHMLGIEETVLLLQLNFTLN